MKDIVQWDLYDTVTLKCWERPFYQMFSYPLGTNDKDEIDTNMHCAGMLPAPSVFVIHNLVVLPERGANKKSVDIVWSNYVVTLQILMKYQFQTVLDRFPTNSDYTVMWNKEKSKWILPRPIQFHKNKPCIPMTASFTVILQGKENLKFEPFKVKVILSGELERSLQ